MGDNIFQWMSTFCRHIHISCLQHDEKFKFATSGVIEKVSSSSLLNFPLASILIHINFYCSHSPLSSCLMVRRWRSRKTKKSLFFKFSPAYSFYFFSLLYGLKVANGDKFIVGHFQFFSSYLRCLLFLFTRMDHCMIITFWLMSSINIVFNFHHFSFQNFFTAKNFSSTHTSLHFVHHNNI